MLSTRRKARPRSMPASSSAASSLSRGSSTAPIWRDRNFSTRNTTPSRSSPARVSSAMSWTLGFNGLEPAMIRATGAPCQMILPSRARLKSGSGAAASVWARATSSRVTAWSEAVLTALADAASPSGRKQKPTSRPTNSPSTKTPPSSSMLRHHIFLLPQAAHQHAGAAVDKTLSEPFMQGIREMILDAAGPQLPRRGSASQLRLAMKVQVRTWAMRVARVSMSPSVRSQ